MMPNKELNRVQVPEVKVMASAVSPSASRPPGQPPKAVVIKTTTKDPTMSPNAPSSDPERPELLGSLTTQQQQRTSARVIKKLRLEPPVDRDKRKCASDDIQECETPNKIDEKDPLKFPTVKQRMPKALWSTDEKNLFFEALNEYGKDFDAITAHICAKMKKKGMPDVNLKTKTQVSHFYYRTWHKLSKHVQFGENVKKVVQELYALINYGELRKKLVSVNEKTCARLGEMVMGGSMVVRARGRNLRVRTPMCRALRRLNQITERACGTRVCSRCVVQLRARCGAAWARVQAAAHNPRAAAALSLRTRLRTVLKALQARWRGRPAYKASKLCEIIEVRCDDTQKEPEDYQEQPRSCEESKEEDREDLEYHLNLEPDRILVQEQKQSKKMALHVGPRPGAQIHLPVVSPSEQLSSQKICFSSYLERMGQRDKDGVAKIRTSKRQRKDSASEKDKDTEPKKYKMEDVEPNKMMHIDETAIDGIELMANYKSNQEDEEKPSTEDEKDLKADETAEDDVERDKDMSEREKDSFSEMEDDEKYNKSDTDNESDHGKNEKGIPKKFKNLKVKFRIRPKKRGGSRYTLVVEKDQEEAKNEEPVKPDEDPKPDFDVEMALKQIRKGWSVHDAGDLTIGDLYLMFGSRSKIELDYWWAEPTPPLPQPVLKTTKLPDVDKDRHIEKRERPEKGDSGVEDERERRESDTDIFSPKNTFSQDSNDGLSGDERKSEQLLSPDHKSGSASLRLVNKLINRPLAEPTAQTTGFGLMSDSSASGNVEAVEATAGQYVEQLRRNSLTEQLKALKVARVLAAKRLGKLSPVHKKQLAELKQKKQIGHFKMPDAPEQKVKGKGKGREDTRVWVSCPLLPGVPTVPPPHVPQPWELQRSHEITKEKEDSDIDGTPPDLIIPMDSPGTPLQIAPQSVMDITDATEEMCPSLIIIPGSLATETETVSPARSSARKKNREIQLPVTGIIQSTVLPHNTVSAEIEFLGFPPSSTTSTTSPGAGRSANDSDVDLDIERDFIEPGEGSDVEHEDLVDITSIPRNVAEYPADGESLTDLTLAEAMRSIEAEADLALRTVLRTAPDQDLLRFDWRCEPDNFKGVREVFTAPSTGPTFDNTELTPLGVFLKIWDANIITHIVRETNRYGGEILRCNLRPSSRIRRWKDVTDDDIKKFFAIIMLQSLVANNVEREYWYPKFDELRIGNFGAIMPYNRFLEIKRCLHFVDNASLPVQPNRLDKIMPIIEHLNKKFSSLYVLEQNVAIDESLLLWKGRLSFSQKIATKKARVGIKSYELCESSTGYLWRMEVYSGKGHVYAQEAQELVEKHEEGDESESATSKIVLTLMRPLFNRGHTLVMDNFYNSPLLSRILKVKHKTDSMGTLRLTREFVPEGLKNKAKKNMKAGEVAFSTTEDLSVVVWMDRNVVAMISSFHQVKVGGKEKYGYYKYKPQVILDYNLSMGGIDRKDQMLHGYPIERIRNIIWYKKLFRRLVNVSIHNSFVMFNHNRTQVIGNREFRLQLVKELLQMFTPGVIPRPLEPAAPVPPSQMHLPAKNDKAQRCKLCHAAKVRRTTVWRCSTCAVNLCIEGCYTKYHMDADNQ